jgi:hypothetical protein
VALQLSFPRTSTVESDFSVINREYDEFRGSLTEFSLEGILQSKQFKRLQDMKHSSALRTEDIVSYFHIKTYLNSGPLHVFHI